MAQFPGRNRKTLNGDNCRPITSSNSSLIDSNIFSAVATNSVATTNPFNPSAFSGGFSASTLTIVADDCTSGFCTKPDGQKLTVISADPNQAPVVIDDASGGVTVDDDFNVTFTAATSIPNFAGEWEFIFEVCVVMYDGKEITYTYSVKETLI